MVAARLATSTLGSLVHRDDGAFARAASAPATRKGYRSDWACFAAWCQGQGLVALTAAPETVGGYLGAKAAWQSAAGIETGRLLRSVDRHGQVGDGLSDKPVALVVKRRAEAAGLDPAVFSGHSLRADLATSAEA